MKNVVFDFNLSGADQPAAVICHGPPQCNEKMIEKIAEGLSRRRCGSGRKEELMGQAGGRKWRIVADCLTPTVG